MKTTIIRKYAPFSLRKAVRKTLEKLPDLTFFRFLQKDCPPTCVYQVGKVGSMSVYQSLKRQYKGAVLHTHVFSRESKNWKLRKLYKWALIDRKPVNMVTLLREPVGRHVSSFFHNFERNMGNPLWRTEYTTKRLTDLLIREPSYDLPRIWMQKNIVTTLGIDVFTVPFPKKEGYAWYKRRNIRLLLLQSELADERKREIIGDFLNLPDFTLVNSNIAENKWYAETYNNFLKNAKLPPDYLDKMCNSAYFRHFYDDETIDRVRKRWSAP